jgi:hypothetical protein
MLTFRNIGKEKNDDIKEVKITETPPSQANEMTTGLDKISLLIITQLNVQKCI